MLAAPGDTSRTLRRATMTPSRSVGDRWAILAAAVLWGTTGTAATFAPRGTSSLAIGAAAMGFGAVVLVVAAGRPVLALWADKSARVPLFVGAACVAIYPLAFYTSMAKAGVAVGVTLTIGSSPIAAAVIERIVDGQRLSSRWAVATAVAVAGAVLLGLSGVHVGRSGAVAGVVLALVAGGCYAGYSVAAARLVSTGTESRVAMGAMFGLAAIVLFPVLALTGPALLSTGRGLAVTGYLAVVPMGLGYVLFGRGLRTTSASTATAISLVEPVAAAVLAVLIIHQRLGISGWVGIVLIAASVAALARPAPSFRSSSSDGRRSSHAPNDEEPPNTRVGGTIHRPSIGHRSDSCPKHSR
jgi:drug/metabolite transporter, DME family